ncbi:MAG TPA: LysR family transcriptional regulator [Candidatus Saccharimonadales bacterium]|nr:LysR family transcriptional regulator [Candidatus Saccharimonadales bacterium]
MDDRLKKFAVLVERGSFTHAAEDLHISQPALSLAIEKLERELKTLLVIRGRRLELTDAGRIVYETAVHHRTADENLRVRLAELAHRRPRVRVGMIDSVAEALNDAAEPLDRLEEQADASITVNNSRYLRAAVENREIDLAFVVHENATHPRLDVRPIGTEPFVLVCRPDRLDGFQAGLKAGELADFICYDRHSTTYGHLHDGLTELGIAIRPALYSTNPDIMLNTVLRGRGIAALPYLLTRDLLKTNQLAALERRGQRLTIDCPLDAVRLRGRLLPGVLEDFSARTETVLGRHCLPGRQTKG